MSQSFQRMKIFSVISEINLLVFLRLGYRKRDIEGKKSREAMFIGEEIGRRQEWRRESKRLAQQRSDHYTEMSPYYGWW